MIDIIAVALLQATMGEPQQAPAAETAPAAEAAQAETDETTTRREERRRRRCRMAVMTGSRIPDRACSSQAQEDEWEMDARWLIQRITPNPKPDG
jgi:hypothetical protein